MTRRSLPSGWWIIPLAPFGAAAWVGVIHLMISVLEWVATL